MIERRHPKKFVVSLTFLMGLLCSLAYMGLAEGPVLLQTPTFTVTEPTQWGNYDPSVPGSDLPWGYELVIGVNNPPFGKGLGFAYDGNPTQILVPPPLPPGQYYAGVKSISQATTSQGETIYPRSAFSSIVAFEIQQGEISQGFDIISPIEGAVLGQMSLFSWAQGTYTDGTFWYVFLGSCPESDGGALPCTRDYYDAVVPIGTTSIQTASYPHDGSPVYFNLWIQRGGTSDGTGGSYEWVTNAYATDDLGGAVIPASQTTVTFHLN